MTQLPGEVGPEDDRGVGSVALAAGPEPVAPDHEAAPSDAPEPARRARLEGVDMLRGLVMVLMALDHARDFFSPTLGPDGGMMSPEGLEHPGLALFFTRWVTHFCAPVFVFLAGASAYLYGSRGRSPGQVSRFLLTRGLFLIVLEFTVVQFGWVFALPSRFLVAQVIWAIGVSMVVLSGLIRLPRPLLALLAVAMVAGHNLADATAFEAGVAAARPSAMLLWQKLWALLHVPSFVLLDASGFGLVVTYPLIAWIGVMALGYLFGGVLVRRTFERRALCLALGSAACVAFAWLRWGGGYGDSSVYVPGGESDSAQSLIAFLNTQKYPPSLQFLLMTLGPALVVLPLCDLLARGIGRQLVVIGRVPLLYYVAHIYLLHGAAVLWAWSRYGDEGLGFSIFRSVPSDYPGPLWVAYVAWAAVIVALYPLCRWFGGVKRRSNSAWLSYL